MAKIWQAEEGQPIGGTPVAEKPLSWCVEELGLRRLSRLANPSETVVIGADRHGLFGGQRRFVVVRLDDEETTAHSNEGWKSGYYLVLISVAGLKNKLSGKSRDKEPIH
jgi:hypothetical protein